MEFSQSNDKVKVTVPNVEASNQPETIFTGSKKPHLKECVLIIDHETGEITLERLTHSINVKKTRVEGSSKSQQHLRPSTPSSCSSPAPSSSGQNKPSKPSSSPNKDSAPSNLTPNGHHLSVAGQMNGKSSSSLSAKKVPVSSPLSQSINSGVNPAHAKSSAHVTELSDGHSSSSDDDDSGSGSSSSSGSSSDDEDVEDVAIRKVEQDLCPTMMNATASAHKYSGDSNSSDDDDDSRNIKRSQIEKERCRAVDSEEIVPSPITSNKSSSQETKTRQASQFFSSSGSNYNNNTQQQPTNTLKNQLSKFKPFFTFLFLLVSHSSKWMKIIDTLYENYKIFLSFHCIMCCVTPSTLLNNNYHVV